MAATTADINFRDIHRTIFNRLCDGGTGELYQGCLDILWRDGVQPGELLFQPRQIKLLPAGTTGRKILILISFFTNN